MNVEPEQRAALLGEYIAEHSATVRAAARAFGCSKSTVHKDVSTRLRAVDAALFARVQAVLARNKAERHLPVQRRADAAQPHGNVLVHGGLAAPERSRRCPHRGVVGGNVLPQLHGALFRIGFHIPPPCVPALQWYNIRAAGADYVCGLDFLSHGAYTVGGHKNRGAVRLRSA